MKISQRQEIFGTPGFGLAVLVAAAFPRFQFNDEFSLDFTFNFWYDEMGY